MTVIDVSVWGDMAEQISNGDYRLVKGDVVWLKSTFSLICRTAALVDPSFVQICNANPLSAGRTAVYKLVPPRRPLTAFSTARIRESSQLHLVPHAKLLRRPSTSNCELSRK